MEKKRSAAPAPAPATALGDAGGVELLSEVGDAEAPPTSQTMRNGTGA